MFVLAFFFMLIGSIVGPFQQDNATERTVTIEVTDGNGNPLMGMSAELTLRDPVERVECSTDRNGRCDLVFNSSADLVQGILLLRGSGRQTVTFKGDSVVVPLRLSDAGVLEVPRDNVNEEPEEMDSETFDSADEDANDDQAETEGSEDVSDDVSEASDQGSTDGQDEAAASEGVSPGANEERTEASIQEDSDEPAVSAGEVIPTQVLESVEQIGEGGVEVTPVSIGNIDDSADGGGSGYLTWILAVIAIGLLGAAGWYFTQGGNR